MNVLNNVTAALILVSFSQLPAAIKPKNGAAVMSFRMFVCISAFSLLLFKFRTRTKIILSKVQAASELSSCYQRHYTPLFWDVQLKNPTRRF